ncbi:MAG: adenylyltransferase/cytidyltransferase family protein, partial [Thermoplasmata archaeon]
MVRVMASGVFDILHPGHIFFLEEAKKLGNELVVVVARDSTARKLKHQPIMNEDVRLKMVTALKPVDIAILGHEDDIFK